MRSFHTKRTADVRMVASMVYYASISGGHLGGEGGDGPPIFWKTIVFCSKSMEMCDVILPKQ